MQTSSNIQPEILEKANLWLGTEFDATTRQEVQSLIQQGGSALIDAFYTDLEFGTGGLRGIMGAGTNRMNRYTVGMATQGLANYLKQTYTNEDIKVVISHDSRINSRFFSETAADVLSANGIHVYLFDALRPTPELSFAVRQLKAHSGIMVTASHNPKEYNGYKVYWSDGGQLLPPHDKNTITEVRKVSHPSQVLFEGDASKIHTISYEMDELYWNELTKLSLGDEGKDQLRIVFTPIHGTGINGVPQILKRLKFSQVEILESQARPDGNFPTVHSPNPEEKAALSLAIQEAMNIDADLVLATDPDADRVGIAVRNKEGEMVLMNGNETASVLIHFILSRMKERGLIKPNQFIAKTIVTTDLLTEIAQSFGVKVYECLTGFKYIAGLIQEKEGKEEYIAGGEESYGYLISDFVRDKDAVGSAAIIAEAAAWCKHHNMTLPEYLEQIHQEHHAYLEDLISITKKGKAGAEEISEMMASFRRKPLTEINGVAVQRTLDYQWQTELLMKTGETQTIQLPKSNVFQFVLDDGSIITARPSGTEPKIKFYISVRAKVQQHETYEKTLEALRNRISGIKNALEL